MQKKIVKRPQPLDINILSDLYQYRVLTTKQLAQRHFQDRDNISYLHRKLYILRNSGYMETKPLVNSKKKREGSCHFIKDKGISFLRQNGILHHPKKSDDIQVSKKRLYYIVNVNQIMLDLESSGWITKDSRDTKRIYRINRGDLIQGTITSPDHKTYAIYYLAENAPEITIVNVIKQIKRIKSPDLHNIAVFFSGENALNLFSQKQKELELVVGGELILLPFKFGIKYLQHFPTENQFVNFVTKNYGTLAESDHPSFKYVLNINREEKYLINLLTNDAMKIFDIERYTIDEYKRHKRKLMALVTSRFYEKYHDMFIQQPHIEIVPVDTNLLFERSPAHA